jgi:hypothetical protein
MLIVSSFLSCITKLPFFKNVTNCCLALFTHGIIERIFISTIKYISTTKGYVFPTEIPKGESVHRINEKIFTKTNAKRIKKSAALLFPFQTYILSLVIADQMFMFERSIETCETYQQILDSNLMYAKDCLVRPKSVPNIAASEFFNPINAFHSNPQAPHMDVSSFCQNSSTLQNETLLMNYHIQCMKYFFRWSNIINTLTNALQWHQITIFIIKTSLYFTFSWQNALGHTKWWLKASMIYRFLILVLLTVLWTTFLVIYILIIVAFNKTLGSTQVILTLQASAVLLIPMFVIPFLFYNTLTVFQWAIRTIRWKKCEQEVSLTFDTYRNVLIYAEHNKNQKQLNV